jgi:non-heme chloroperoxidase
MEPVIRSVVLPNGVRLPYVEQGNPEGVPVLFLHGATDSSLSFERVLPELPQSIHAFALSMRGHGDADRPESGYRPQDFAADLATFMDALGLGPAVVVGHCMGSSVAQRFAIDHPTRVLGLVLIGSRATWRSQPDVMQLCDYVLSTLTDPVDPGFVREFQESTLAQPVPPSYLDAVVQESLKLPARVWKAVFGEGVLEADHSAQLGRIQAPTLLLCGDRDNLARDAQESLAAAIPGSRLVAYPRAGHALHWEEPERFATDLLAFVGSLSIPVRPDAAPRCSDAYAADSYAGSAPAGIPSGPRGLDAP